FGKGSPRLVKVIAGQAAYTGPCEAHVAALDDETINPNGTRPDAYAIAPYFKGNSVGDLENNGFSRTTQWGEDSYECAKGAGLPLIAYEGGQDSYEAGEGPCTQLQHNAGMAAIYTKFLNAMQGANLKGPYVQYTHSGKCWGLKEKTSDSLENS